MKVDLKNDEVELTLNQLELLVLRHSFVEICYGFHLDNIEKKIGISEEETRVFCDNFSYVYQKHFPTRNKIQINLESIFIKFKKLKNNQVILLLSTDKIEVIKNALFETLEELNHVSEFHARSGVDREVGVNLLNELNSFFDNKKIK